MELTNDILLHGAAWSSAIEQMSFMFKTRTNYMIYMLSMSIGIMYDQRIEKPEDNGENPKYILRNIFANNDNGKLDIMFQTAILTTTTETLSEDERLELAFGEKAQFNRIGFLTQFANFGVTKLLELVGESKIETMENVKNFLVSTVEGQNFEIDSLPDDVLLVEDVKI